MATLRERVEGDHCLCPKIGILNVDRSQFRKESAVSRLVREADGGHCARDGGHAADLRQRVATPLRTAKARLKRFYNPADHDLGVSALG